MKAVSYTEAHQAFRNLGWREDFLIENEVTGVNFYNEIKEELEIAKEVLSRKFNKKAKDAGLFEKLTARVNRIEEHVFNAYQFDTIQ
nr:hypothetical protein [uncultured Haemophilus sp.]